MKKHNLTYALLLIPLFVWGQMEEPVLEEIQASDVILIEDPGLEDSIVEVPMDEIEPIDSAEVPFLDDQPVIVEIPEEAISGVTFEAVSVEIPNVTTALPGDAAVVLELPSSGGSGGAVVQAEEETISVDFLDEDVRIILRNVADLFDLNLVIPDTLQGRTSIKLRNITWGQVFEVVLEPLGYTYVEDRNIIRIKSIEEITTEPVDTRVFVVSYAKASELQGSISPLVDTAAGGRIQVDTRSNALVITERPSKMNAIQEIIELLDKPNHQVMIESKFVEVSNEDAKNIGVDWSFTTDNESSFEPFAATPGTGDGGQFGGFLVPNGFENGLLAVFSDDEFAVTLNALQQKTDTKLVSNPTVVVMNNKEAIFQVGEDYPLREFTVNRETGELESGEVEYRFVGIELKVTPSVNAAGMISLDVHPSVSARLEGETVSGPDGLEDQIFRTREAHTFVTIKDGYTIALGGLTDESVSLASDKIPVLGDIPVIGKLFQSNGDTVSNSNLIIFLTAKTLNPDGTTYREIIDPRKLDAIGHTESQTPGYVVPSDHMAFLREVEAKRELQQRADMKASVEAREERDRKRRQTYLEEINETFKFVEEPPAEAEE